MDQEADPTPAVLKTWDTRDAKARRIIGFTVIDELQGPVREARTAKEAWDELEKLHAPNDRQRQFALTRQLYACKMTSSTPLRDHEREFSAIIEALRATGKSIEPIDVITQYLLSLSEEYQNYALGLNMKIEDTWTFNTVKGMVRVEEQRMSNIIASTSEPIDREAVNANFAKSKSDKKKWFTGKCHHCGIVGHMEVDYRKRVEDEKRQKSKSEDAFGGLAYALLAATHDKIVKDSNLWIFDCGASHYMHPDRSLFVDYRTLTTPISIGGIRGSLSAVGIGLVPIADNVGNIGSLENTLHVPGLKSGLLSLTRAAMDKGWESHIGPDGCTITSENLRIHAPIGLDGLCRYKSISASAAVATVEQRGIHIDTWHERFCHGSKEAIQKLVDHVEGLKILNTDWDESYDKSICEGCVSGKHYRLPFHSVKTEVTKPGERIHCDLCGEIQERSLGNGVFIAMFTDELTRYRRVAILEDKKATTVASAFRQFKAWFETQFDHKVKALRTDEGPEFADQMDLLLKDSGIEHEPTVAYSSQSNGISERANRTIMDMVRPMLHSSGLPLSLWGEAAGTACYVKNRMSTRGLPTGMTPYEAITGRKPRVDHLRAFGSVCYVYIPKKLRKKLDQRSRKGYLVGYHSDGEHPIYRVFIPSKSRIILARDVIINEWEVHPVGDGPRLQLTIYGESDEIRPIFDTAPMVVKGRGHPQKIPAPTQQKAPVPRPQPRREIAPDPVPVSVPDRTPDLAPVEEVVEEQPVPLPMPPPPPAVDVIEPPVVPAVPLIPAVLPEVPVILLKSSFGRSLKPPKRFGDLAVAAFCASVAPPRNYKEAMKRPDRPKWEIAMERELQSIKDNDVWELVPRPKNQKVIDSLWVLNIKDNWLHKARFCAKGFAQQWGVDYTDTFAPVAKYKSVRTLFAIAAGLGLEVHQMDVVTAFLYGLLDEIVYVEQPEGYEVPGHEDWVYRLKRALYDLKQAPYAWYENIKAVLLGFEFVKCESDHGIFVTERDGNLIYLAVYVDDLLIMGKRIKDIEEIKDLLKKRYKMKDLGIAKRFLGIDIEYGQNGSIKLHLKQYLQTLLERHDMQDCNPVSTPMDLSVKLIATTETDALADPKEYQQIVGEIQFAAIVARPDVSCAISTLSQFSIKPSSKHLAAAKRVLRYLKGTIDAGVVYSTGRRSFSIFRCRLGRGS